MVATVNLVQHCDQLLESSAFQDYAPNGLQVEGSEVTQCLISGVTASEALIDVAIERNAQTILVHHGYFWRGEKPQVTGMKRTRLAKLLTHNINLIAYHLPLDAHVELGNNAQLATLLGIDISGRFALQDGSMIGFLSQFDAPVEGDVFAQHVGETLGRKPLHIAGTNRPIKSFAWCSGGAQDAIELAHAQGADAFLTGEVSERTVHIARELGMHFFAAGHHATERYGAKALGEHLAKQFSIEHHFVDIDNPV